LNEYEFPKNKIANVQAQLEKLLEKNYYLHRSARDAYRSYLQAYASHALKDIFNVHALDLEKVAKGLGFSAPPKVNLSFHESTSISRRKRRVGPNRHVHPNGQRFSAENPYGTRALGDKRQFSYA